MRKPELIEAVQALTDQGFGWDGGEDAIVWPESNTGDAPTRVAIDAKLIELLADWTAKQYQRDRAAGYPPIAEQLDILYHSGVTGLKAELKKTKDKYPKG